MKLIFYFGALATVCLALTGCGTPGQGAPKKPERIANEKSEELQFKGPQEGDTIAVFDTDKGQIRAVLYPKQAPMAVENFIGLVGQGYYNGLSFHRIVENFVVQTGDATGTGTGGATIWNNNPFPVEPTDALHHYSGALAMAHVSGDAVSNTSQFYFVQTLKNSLDKASAQTLTDAGLRQEVVDAYRAVGGAPYLDNLYTVFGQIYEGMEVLDALAAVPCDENGQPDEPLLLQTVEITTYTVAAESVSGSTSAAENSTTHK